MSAEPKQKSIVAGKNKDDILRDQYGRFMRKLRISLTDECNFRCFYCMPVNAKFMPKAKYLPPEKIYEICKNLVNYGVSQIRITGGEPTMRSEFAKIISLLGNLNVQKFGLTTNGLGIYKHLQLLHDTNCRYLNISLDSLEEDKFNQITHSRAFKRVMRSIFSAKERGLEVKLNVVLLRGSNDDEVENFVDFSSKYNIPVRFLEVMRIGMVANSPQLFISAGEVLAELRQKEDLLEIESERDSTSFNYVTRSGAQIGFIASESQPFCDACSRLRLSPQGKLRACLMSPNGLDFSKAKIEEFPRLLTAIIGMKPNFRLEKIMENMNKIGG